MRQWQLSMLVGPILGKWSRSGSLMWIVTGRCSVTDKGANAQGLSTTGLGGMSCSSCNSVIKPGRFNDLGDGGKPMPIHEESVVRHLTQDDGHRIDTRHLGDAISLALSCATVMGQGGSVARLSGPSVPDAMDPKFGMGGGELRSGVSTEPDGIEDAVEADCVEEHIEPEGVEVEDGIMEGWGDKGGSVDDVGDMECAGEYTLSAQIWGQLEDLFYISAAGYN